MDKHYKRLSVEFPAEEYIYLKMACAKQGVSMKDFVTKAVIMYIEEYENKLDAIALQEALTEENLKNAIPWEQAKKELGWNKL